ncbi:MAG: hypothetical protein II773_13285, partial [Oscillospiraceae bacterium]|nr:hypothetical protein [Oscillospiraceae bacterium]
MGADSGKKNTGKEDNKSGNIHQGHRSRLRKRYLATGLSGFDDHQILEMLLFYAYPMKDMNEKAHKLIEQFGDLQNMMSADAGTLMKAGLNENAAVLLKMIPDICSKCFEQTMKRERYDSPEKLKALFSGYFNSAKKEEFVAACFYNDLTLAGMKQVSEGTPSDAPTALHMIISFAVSCGSTLVVLSHNHPGISAKPSQSDLAVTMGIKNFLA